MLTKKRFSVLFRLYTIGVGGTDTILPNWSLHAIRAYTINVWDI
jgi:hypothetical protein